MVPGFSDPTAMWAPLMAELTGFTVHAVDRPCFGLTGPAKHTTRTFRTLAVAFLEQVLDGLRLERPLFVANSIGSLWAIWLAIDRPDRVAAMTHVGCPAFILDTCAPLPMRLLSVPVLGRLLMKMSPPSHRQVDRFAAMVGADLSRLPELRDLLAVMQALPGVPEAIRELLHAAIHLRGVRPEVALTAGQLAQVTQPVQLIWGENDPFGAPGVGEQAAAIIPDAELHVIPGAGHVPWVDHPEQVGTLASRFLHARRHGRPTARG
jgi:2-hydroxy-6-oxonona-2,4-dienedioate hydrolase/4,5:9,10-diseco-3-hydroxy-5,9,17-trioxoandrosta-1(10),2-diene-4-oate hydrolase